MSVQTNPFDTGYYESGELRAFGFADVGDRVRIARNCTIIGLHNISIGHDVRIDGFTVIAAANGPCRIGSFIHIGGGGHLACGGGVTIEDFANLSQGVRVYSVSDDYSGACLTNPTIPVEFQQPKSAPVMIGRHVIIGSGSVVLPGVGIGEGCAIGALSLVPNSLEAWGIYGGIPVRRIKARSRQLLEAEGRLLSGRR